MGPAGNIQGAKGPAGPIPLLPSHTSYSYNYKVKKNNKATNRHYSGLWPYIITQSGNLTCQTPECSVFSPQIKVIGRRLHYFEVIPKIRNYHPIHD